MDDKGANRPDRQVKWNEPVKFRFNVAELLVLTALVAMLLNGYMGPRDPRARMLTHVGIAVGCAVVWVGVWLSRKILK
jgi:hypothetical protein